MEDELKIEKECVLPMFQAENAEQVIRALSERMKIKNYVKEDFEEAVLLRENKYPTGLQIGKYNIAIPHTEPEYVNQPCVGIATLHQKVPFHRMDASEEEVDVNVVLLLALKEAHSHMEMLSRIILMCNDESFVSSLLNTQTAEEIVGIVSDRLLGGNEHE